MSKHRLNVKAYTLLVDDMRPGNAMPILCMQNNRTHFDILSNLKMIVVLWFCQNGADVLSVGWMALGTYPTNLHR